MKAAWVWMASVGMAVVLNGCMRHDTHDASAQPPPDAFILPPRLPLPADTVDKDETPSIPSLPQAFGLSQADKLVTWRCTPAQDLIAAFPDDHVRLWSTQGYYELPQVVSADGARYQRDGITFWSKGREALIGNGDRQGQCQVDAERSPEQDTDEHARFHALGGTPQWSLTLADDTPQVLIELGQGEQHSRIALPYEVRFNRDGHEARFIAAGEGQGHDMRVDIRAKACFDRMTGKPYPAQVTLMLDGKRFEGCGEALH